MEFFGNLDLMRMISSVFFVGIVWLLVHLYKNLWLKSEIMRRKLRMQGIKGPPPSILYGNLSEMQKIQSDTSRARAQAQAQAQTQTQAQKSKTSNCTTDIIAHDYTCTLFPYFERWRKQYGPVYMYSTGRRQHLYVNKPELVKEMNQSISLDLGKPSYVTKRLAPMLGNGILRSNGQIWAQQRKIVAPEFFMEKVKGMVGLMVESTLPLLKKWQDCIEFEAQGGGLKAADIQVDEDLRGISADVIARACFGSSYLKGEEIFSKLRRLQKAISNQSFLFGVTSFASRFLSTQKQNEINNLEREVESLIWDTVKERECLLQTSSSEKEKDLMQLILEGALNDQDHPSVGKGKDSFVRFIVDNCKNIYFAGHESTAVAASWTLMLLALHPEWQARIRTELSQICGHDGFPDADCLPRLKTVSMVIQESLRLYPPAAFVSREALEDTQIGNIKIPKGVYLWTLIPTLHRDPEIWGEDANEFKPERFSDSVSKACKYPQAYIPFGVGPRVCLGKNFAMVQLKIIISLIVSKFRLSLSPKYQHSPAYRMIVEPGHGVQILFQNI